MLFRSGVSCVSDQRGPRGGAQVGAAADMRAGVVALTLFDLRSRGRVGRVLLADALGACCSRARRARVARGRAGRSRRGCAGRWALASRPRARRWRTKSVACTALARRWRPSRRMMLRWTPARTRAMATMVPGDAVIVFTPDDTHFDIALAALRIGLHVLVAKPLVKVRLAYTHSSACAHLPESCCRRWRSTQRSLLGPARAAWCVPWSTTSGGTQFSRTMWSASGAWVRSPISTAR